MKFNVTKSELLTGLQRVQGVASSRTSLPVLVKGLIARAESKEDASEGRI